MQVYDPPKKMYQPTQKTKTLVVTEKLFLNSVVSADRGKGSKKLRKEPEKGHR